MSSLASDPQLAPFLAPTFSAVDYLNAALPTLAPSASTPTAVGTSSLADVTAQSQAILARLNAQLTRLSATLTSLTDDILRAGGRLAYEVELLRADTGSLGDTLATKLRGDIGQFVPAEETRAMLQPLEELALANDPIIQDSKASTAGDTDEERATKTAIERLRMLTRVREQLDAVVRVFGEAMAWPVAPSEVTQKSSFISVAGPTDETAAETVARERAGQEHTDKLRAEIGDLVASGTDEGELAAYRRIEALRELASVWQGTSEEKARLRVVDGLAKLVEEKKKAVRGAGRSGYGLGSEFPPR